MPFEKGKSGNPGGRVKETPEIKEAKEALRKLAPDAAKAVEVCLKSKKFIERKWAAETVLSYSIGKPTQMVELSDDGTGPISAILEIVRKAAA